MSWLCHGYEGVMSILCTPLQVKCYLAAIDWIFRLSIFCSRRDLHIFHIYCE